MRASIHSTTNSRYYKLNRELRMAVHSSGRPIWRLAQDTGFNHQTQFSALINKQYVPTTRLNIERLYRIADAVGFDRTQLFVQDEAAQ